MRHKRSFRALYAFALVASLVFSMIRLTGAQALPEQPTPKPPSLEDSGDYIEPMTASLKPTILHKEKPKYTLEAYGHNVQGEVVLSAVFAGRITGIRVVCGLPHGLTENAIAAAKKIRFEPAVKNGAPVSVRATLIYTFRIL
jgi:hypothetical protein